MYETLEMLRKQLENRAKEIARRSKENATYIASNQQLLEKIRAENTIAENATLTSTIFLCLVAPGILCGLILPPVMLIIPAILFFVALISSVVAQMALADKETFDARISANNQGVEYNNRHIESIELSAKYLRENIIPTVEQRVARNEAAAQAKRPASTTPDSPVGKLGIFKDNSEHQDDSEYDSGNRPRSGSCP